MTADNSTGWQGRLYLGIGLAVYVGRVGHHASHQHYASQLAICTEASLAVVSEDHQYDDGHCLICPANMRHKLIAPDVDVTLIFVEPTTRIGRLMHLDTKPRSPLSVEKLTQFMATLVPALDTGNLASVNQLVYQLLADDDFVTLCTRDMRLITLLNRTDFELVPPSVSEAASSIHLSVSRFSHLFSAQMGIGYRSFVRWRKLLSAIKGAATNQTLTWAAHDAGFADAAHFSRTFHTMFGLAPSSAFTTQLSFKSLA